MGVILDSTVVIQAERRGDTETQMILNVAQVTGEQDLGISSIGLTELLHAIYRAATPAARERREAFLKQVVDDFPIYPYTREVAILAGRIGGEQAARGYTIPFADLLIGATALSLGFSVLTSNQRHFRLIPGLDIIAF